MVDLESSKLLVSALWANLASGWDSKGLDHVGSCPQESWVTQSASCLWMLSRKWKTFTYLLGQGKTRAPLRIISKMLWKWRVKNKAHLLHYITQSSQQTSQISVMILTFMNDCEVPRGWTSSLGSHSSEIGSLHEFLPVAGKEKRVSQVIKLKTLLLSTEISTPEKRHWFIIKAVFLLPGNSTGREESFYLLDLVPWFQILIIPLHLWVWLELLPEVRAMFGTSEGLCFKMAGWWWWWYVCVHMIMYACCVILEGCWRIPPGTALESILWQDPVGAGCLCCRQQVSFPGIGPGEWTHVPGECFVLYSLPPLVFVPGPANLAQRLITRPQS